ncbi:hypothetical protein Patl1_18926 [Pistacia atlantica]|uniref:Uncharacterized protein n=1 Tax=Pistacia atlantica TaxID=434234 RepID=A0ACC1C2K9_9ROSI|nr:hypothetical protein Patl1_18926 [Pistacia atlantica]
MFRHNPIASKYTNSLGTGLRITKISSSLDEICIIKVFSIKIASEKIVLKALSIHSPLQPACSTTPSLRRKMYVTITGVLGNYLIISLLFFSSACMYMIDDIV